MGYTLIRPAIRRYFEEHPGINVWLADLREKLVALNGKTPSDGGIQHAINTLMGAGLELFVVERGQCWIYRPNMKSPNLPEPTNQPVVRRNDILNRRLFELIHTTKTGAMILEDEEGETIIVKPVDI